MCWRHQLGSEAMVLKVAHLTHTDQLGKRVQILAPCSLNVATGIIPSSTMEGYMLYG